MRRNYDINCLCVDRHMGTVLSTVNITSALLSRNSFRFYVNQRVKGPLF